MKKILSAILAADMFGYSRLMENGEIDVITRQSQYLKDIIQPEILNRNGTLIKTTGDGFLAIFNTVQESVESAIAIQTRMILMEEPLPHDQKIQYRLGINAGDLILNDNDIFGDSVNIAARLEGLSVPDGICLSDIIYQLINDDTKNLFEDLGSQRVKNISRPIKVWQWDPKSQKVERKKSSEELQQQVQFCLSEDDAQIAFARVGTGATILKAPNWLNHIEYEWRSPIWGPLLNKIATQHELIRFDQRGGGLSDWDVSKISEDRMISDMINVVNAAGLERFTLLGISQGCAFSIRYAFENPEKVNGLILFGGYVRGRLMRNSEESKILHETAQSLIAAGWGSNNPAFRTFFTSSFIPDATVQQASSFDELQRVSTSAKNGARIQQMNATVDVSELAKQLKIPCLVLHCEGDQITPHDEGRRMAALIPGSQFVTLEGNNHALIENTPAFDKFVLEVTNFVKGLS